MFETVDMAPADPILGLTEAFKSDPDPDKINLSVGVYKDEGGRTPIFTAVKEAERKLLEVEDTKSYLPIPGSSEYGAAVQGLLFGEGHSIIGSGRAVTAQAPGGTAALRVAADLIKSVCPQAKIWVSDPTWANHRGVFSAAGLEVAKYPYYDAPNRCLDFAAMLDALKSIGQGDVVLLHGCCHNPSGMDPSPEQWKQIADVAAERKFTPLIDFAYQGFGNGLEEDARGLREMCRVCDEVMIANSFSKNFGLYRERVGALTAVCASADVATRVFSHIKMTIRRNYSNPPAHGGAIVTTILNDAALRRTWEKELSATRERIQSMRRRLVETLKAKGVKRDFSFITRQTGMFSFSGLAKVQVERLREQYAIYIVNSGRINVAGLTLRNMDRFCQAVAEVLGEE